MQTNLQKSYVASLINEICVEVFEQIRRTGTLRVDADELSALKEGAKARLAAMASSPFGHYIDSDRELALNLTQTRERAQSLRTKRDVFETRHNNAREQTERIPAPNQSLAGILATAIGVFTICFAPTIYSAFLASMEDSLFAWVVAVILGAAMGGFLALLLVHSEGAGSMGAGSSLFGYALGIGCGLMRAARADSAEGFLLAVALTLIECAAVAGLDRFAHRHRQAVDTHRVSHSQSVALEEAISTVNSRIAEEEGRYAQHLSQLKQREAEAFDVGLAAEQVAAAVEAAYRSAISANQRLLEGGALEPSAGWPNHKGEL